jgi:Putative Actinobacterial Holin-X, holin superfamily III
MISDQQELRSANGSGLTPLIAGIVRDAQTLIGQQLALFQSEFKKDLGKTKDAVIPLAVGMAVCLLAGFFVFMMAAHLAVWLWPDLPLFAAYGIVGVVLAILGGSLVAIGKSKFEAFDRLGEKSVEGLKENVQWTTKT